MNIRPVSELRNHFPEIEEAVQKEGPIILTKNGYGSMVVMSLDQFEYVNGGIERALDEADAQASSLDTRLSHDEVFSSLKRIVS